MQGKLNKILLVISSMLFFAALFGWYSSAMPKFYESKTVLSIKPPTISTRVVPNLTEEDLAQKLQPMNEEILSRTSIEVMISKYGLFEKEKAQGMPIELIIDKMRKNIRVNPEKSDLGEWRNFLITYRDTTPENARNVAAELATKYVNSAILGCNLGQREDDFEDIKIKIVDPANLPQSPIYPTTTDLTLIGAGFGFIFSLFLLGLGNGVNYLNNRFGKIILQ